MGLFILLIVVAFPLLSAILGVVGYFIFKLFFKSPFNFIITPILVLLASLIFMYFVIGNNSTFFYWIAIYTATSFATGLITFLLSRLLTK